MKIWMKTMVGVSSLITLLSQGAAAVQLSPASHDLAAARLRCDASPNYPRWDFAQVLLGDVPAGEITAEVQGGLLLDSATLHRGSISGASGSRNAILHDYGTKCMLGNSHLSLAPEPGHQAYISHTDFLGGDSRPGQPISVEAIFTSTDGKTIDGPVFEDVTIGHGAFYFVTPIRNFSHRLTISAAWFDFQSTAIDWKEIFGGVTFQKSLSISGMHSWSEIDFKALAGNPSLRGLAVRTIVGSCKFLGNEEYACDQGPAPVAELRDLVSNSGVASIMIDAVTTVGWVKPSVCKLTNIDEICADPVLAKAVSFVEVGHYNSERIFTCSDARPVVCN
jgi:hypothetical protein